MEKKIELRSLNAKLPPLYLEELEQRLETDPLAIGGLLSANFNLDACDIYCETKCSDYCASDCPNDCGTYCKVDCGEYSK